MHLSVLAIIPNTTDVRTSVERLVAQMLPGYPRDEWSFGGRYAEDGEPIESLRSFEQLMSGLPGCIQPIAHLTSKSIQPLADVKDFYDSVSVVMGGLHGGQCLPITSTFTTLVSVLPSDALAVLLDMHSPPFPDFIYERLLPAEVESKPFLSITSTVDPHDPKIIRLSADQYNEDGSLGFSRVNEPVRIYDAKHCVGRYLRNLADAIDENEALIVKDQDIQNGKLVLTGRGWMRVGDHNKD